MLSCPLPESSVTIRPLPVLSCHLCQPAPFVGHVVFDDAEEDALDGLGDGAALAVAYGEAVD